MSTSISINLKESSYKIHIKENLLKEIAEQLSEQKYGQKYAIITDSNVNKHYGEFILNQLREKGIETDVFIIPAGESSKSIHQVEILCEALIEKGYHRNSCLIALGGGVVGDISGFIASIFLRGIAYIHIPTTIVSQVDSSIGGKTGVNLSKGKNLIGSFYHPKAILIDPKTLSSLPQKIINEGFAEIIKHSCIQDFELFKYLEQNLPSIPDTKLIHHNIKIKAKIVEADEKETLGIRQFLNFGHTLGHSIEANNYHHFFHGEAISIGMRAALYLSEKITQLSPAQSQRILKLLHHYNLPLTLPKEISTKNLLKIMQRDKKFQEGIRYVLLKEIGKATLSEKVTWEKITEAIEHTRLKPLL